MSAANNKGGLSIDMTGNVKEWTQARATAQNPLRGGASNNAEPGLTCSFDFTLGTASFTFPNLGFRCCSNTAP